MTLAFWFDVHSPWCYFAAHRIGDIARSHGQALTWKPIHLPRLLDAIGGIKPMEATPARVRWFKQDILDWSEALGIPIRQHPDYPLRNSRALRVCQYAEEQGAGEAVARRVLRAYWLEEADITDPRLLARWAEESGLDGEAAATAALSDDYKRCIDANTDEAIGRGVFGVPTVDTGSKLYFGNDRLDMLDRHLSKLMPSSGARPSRDSR